MATIIVEDGTGLTTSNSYVSAAELATYASDRGVTITGTDTELLISAMDYLEQQQFQGVKETSTQALQWPRSWVVIDGYYLTASTIPQLLKDAQCELALAIDAGNTPLATVARQTSSETVGPISVTYMSGTYELPKLTAVNLKLKKLLQSNGSGAYVYRG